MFILIIYHGQPISLKIGALGHYLPLEFAMFQETVSMYHQDKYLQIADCGKETIHGSYQIFLARSSAFRGSNKPYQ